MRATILTVGTHGDVQPYVALALGLQREGHQARFATYGEHRAFIEDNGVEYVPIEGDMRARLTSDDGIAWLESGRNPVAYFRLMEQVIRPLMEGTFRSSLAACRGADVVIGPLVACRVAERLGIPHVLAPAWPFARTRAFPSPLTWLPGPLRRVPPANYLSYVLLERLTEGNRSRGGPGLLSRMESRHTPHVYPFSAAVVPKPRDWRPWHHVTGYWFLDAAPGWRPPAELVSFLDAGPSPVYVGFGSTVQRDPEAVVSVVLDALRRAGSRGILQGPWVGAECGPLTDDVYVVSQIPHHWLFRRVSAVVHHGGAGTTGSGLGAGVPSVIVPFYADQLFWAARVADLRVGPRPVFYRRLTARRLARAIAAAVNDPGIRDRAAAIGRRIDSEDGVSRAVSVIGDELRAA